MTRSAEVDLGPSSEIDLDLSSEIDLGPSPADPTKEGPWRH